MDRESNGPTAGASSSTGGNITRSAFQLVQPNYSSRAVQKALFRLASIDLIELRNEAKVEHCRATRDLRSCGRDVHHILNSCNHASLCAECSQRCDVCPICRVPISKTESKVSLRLYYECMEAGLIPKRSDERVQAKDGREKGLTADVHHLYSFFDVALENNLVSLICHYVTDVCMDEGAVSSDPVTAFLLDEVVVKDWCKRTFRNIIAELQGIYKLGMEEMKSRLSLLLKLLGLLVGISNVLEVLESSFKDALLARLNDLQNLQERILKTKQHMEVVMWCIRHQFLENVRPRYIDFASWRSAVDKRKSAAMIRSWPNALDDSTEPSGLDGSLFIEDALKHLEVESLSSQGVEDDLDIPLLQKDVASFILRSKIEGIAACYPFESLQAAVDLLFLHGSYDLVVAKQAIFLYYLFDRHWTMPDEKWRYLVEEFAAVFNISRHSILESLIFYLLDDNTDEALQEACRLLPEISGPTIHPKIAQVLLERKNPETALMVLRWSGHGTTCPSSLGAAVTSVRVRVECGLLTEAFMYQRMVCTKVKEKKHHGPRVVVSEENGNFADWRVWVKLLVNEICYLCIRRNFVDKMIELPWSSDEEKHIHSCLLECSVAQPSTTTGSLLFVFYMQRYRYGEAYQVHQTLQNVEQDFMSKDSLDEDILSRMKSTSHWRAGLVDKFMELLPEAERHQIKAGKLPVETNAFSSEVELAEKSDLVKIQEQSSTGFLIRSTNDHSLSLLLKPPVSETLGKTSGLFNYQHSAPGKNYSPSLLRRNIENGLKPHESMRKNLNKSSPGVGRMNLVNSSHLEKTPRSSAKVSTRSHLLDGGYNKISLETEQNRVNGEYPQKATLEKMIEDLTSKRLQSTRDNRSWKIPASVDQTDTCWSSERKDFANEERNLNCGQRWRSDETSDEDEQTMDIDSRVVYRKTTRRTRVARR